MALAVPAFAQTTIASDSSSNYTGSTWPNSDSPPNEGSGFGSWTFANGGGTFGAYLGGTGESSSSFGIFSGASAFETVGRSFGSDLLAGQTFSISFGYEGTSDFPNSSSGFDSGGNIGINIVDSSGNTELNLNLAGSNSQFTLNDGGTNFGTGVTALAGAAYTFTFTNDGNNQYSYSLTQVSNSSNSVTGSDFTFTGSPDNFGGAQVYTSSQGPSGNVGFDNLSITQAVPEPSAIAMFLGSGLFGSFYLIRRRRK